MLSSRLSIALLSCVSYLALPAYAWAETIDTSTYQKLLERLNALENELRTLKQHQETATPGSSHAFSSHKTLCPHHSLEKKKVCCLKEKSSHETEQKAQYVTKEELAPVKELAVNSVQAGPQGSGFLIPGTDTTLHLYGIVRGIIAHDIRTPATGANYYYVYANALPLDGTGDGRESHQTVFSARESRLGVQTSSTTRYGELGARFEMDFLGYIPDQYNPQVVTNTANMRIRLAYFHFGNWLIGHAPTTLFSLNEVPKSLDLAMGSGIGANRQMQIRYTHHCQQDKLILALGVENPESEYIDERGVKHFTNKPGSGGTEAINRMPDLVAKVDYQDTWGALGTGFLLRELRMKSTANNNKKYAYGIGFNGHFNLLPQTQLMWQLMGGKGIGRYILDAAGHGAFYNSATKKIHTQPAWGGLIALERQWSAAWSSALILGFTRIINDPILRSITAAQTSAYRTTAGGVNKLMKSLHANIIWTPVEAVDVGLGYMYSRREVEDGRKGSSHRVMFNASYKFGAPNYNKYSTPNIPS